MSTAEKIRAVRDNIGKVIVGREETIELTLAAMIAGGHVLLEDVPGTGKTKFAKSLARSLNTSFGRIQFTPDLLPSDVTGLSVYQQQKGEFVFKPGPVFCNILLADEINRATPRTQSGLLECMEERQVTVDGVTRKLEPPFFVIATQNPVETSGTFPLPEAQMDRFLMKLSMGFPDKEEEVAILKRFIRQDALETISPVADEKDIAEAAAKAKEVTASEDMMNYIASLIMETRNRADIASGCSPRGSLALLQAAQVLAVMDDRTYIVPEDVRRLAVPVLAHRLILTHSYDSAAQSESIIRDILDKVPVPTEDFGKAAKE